MKLRETNLGRRRDKKKKTNCACVILFSFVTSRGTYCRLREKKRGDDDSNPLGDLP
jgi:hypothetical protein